MRPLCLLLLAAAPLTAQHSVLQSFIDNRSLAGAVTLTASKDRILNIGTVGYADIGAKKPMHPDTVFWIASMSKPVTAAALMMLVDEGKVSVDDPVEKYLPEFKDQWLAAETSPDHLLLKKPGHPITVRNILSHTSGMPATSAMEKPTLDLLRLRDAVHSYAMTPLLFEPESEYRYANSGINTAGRIIEVVSGLAYEDFLDRRILHPLGMKDTTFWPNHEQLNRLAKSYKSDKEHQKLTPIEVTQLRYPLDDRTRQPMPAGGLFSTARDLSRFCQIILARGSFEGKRYFSETAVKQMTSLQTGNLKINGNDSTGYGFGWLVLRKPAADGRSAGSFGHDGAYKTAMWIDPEKQLIMILLRHHSGDFLSPEGNRIPEVFMKSAISQK